MIMMMMPSFIDHHCESPSVQSAYVSLDNQRVRKEVYPARAGLNKEA